MGTFLIEPVTRLLNLCNSPQSIMPPAALYNEGWMLRLVLDWFDRHRDQSYPFAFKKDARWYSEALLPSRFLATKRADPHAETHTHADGVIGHFAVKPGLRGEAVLLPEAKQFVVIEAKLGSALSAGTKNAPAFDQAARNVACMAHMLSIANVDLSAIGSLGFYLVAPQLQIDAGKFGALVTRESIRSKVASRVSAYSGAHSQWFETSFLPMLTCIDLRVISWESILDGLPHSAEVEVLRAFYDQCLRYSLGKERGAFSGPQ